MIAQSEIERRRMIEELAERAKLDAVEKETLFARLAAVTGELEVAKAGVGRMQETQRETSAESVQRA